MSKPKALLIAEKPSLMRDIKNAYNHCADKVEYDIDFVAQVGHLVELLDPIEVNPIYKDWNVEYLPINPENEGGWKYKVKKDVKDVFDDIKNKINSGNYQYIIHAGDPDQEGELLVNLVLQKVGNKLPVLRFWSNDTTQTALENALQDLKNDNDTRYQNLFNAALIRQHADWLFGMNGSRAIADRIYAGRGNKIAAGRVMTWVQTAIVDREDEIKNFIPKTVYGLKIDFDATNGTYTGNLYEPPSNTDKDKKKSKEDETTAGFVYFDTKKEAEDLLNSLSNIGIVDSITTERVTTYAPKLYKLATAQSDGAKLGYTSNKTLEIIQSLYEKHLVSYPRTDCEVLSSNENLKAMIASASAVPEFTKAAQDAVGSIGKVLGTKKYVNDTELQKHGHSALVPTTNKPDISSLTNDELTIYKMIAKRFLAIFQPPLIQDKTSIITKVDDKLFKTSGKTIIDKGFMDFLGSDVKDVNVPKVEKGESVTVSNKSISEKTSTCPKRFTDGTIIDAMEKPTKYLSDPTIKDSVKDLSIGTPATRGSIIEKLVKDKYIIRQKNELVPTEFSMFMIHAIRGISICRADTTGEWEQTLMGVRMGEIPKENAEKYITDQLDTLLKDTKGINKVSYGNDGFAKEPIMPCPNCGKNIYESARNYYCEGYRDGCKLSIMKTLGKNTQVTKEDLINLLSGKTIKKKYTKKDGSKTWDQEFKYDPEAEWNPTFCERKAENTNLFCPECKSSLQKEGSWIKCNCGFKVWSAPANKQLTEEELGYIFSHGCSESKIKGFVSKAGKKFDAKLKLTCDGSNSKIEFDF